MLALAPFRTSAHLNKILDQVDELPTSARLLPDLQRLLRDDGASTVDVVDLLRLDPTLTAKVIAMSNRAFFGGGQLCGTLDEAVNRLGFDEVYRVVATVAVSGVFNQEMALYGMAEGELMEQSLATAVALPILNRDAAVAIRGDELFTIGLLHGLGKLALNGFAARGGSGGSGIPAGTPFKQVLAVEKKVFKVTHPEVGAALLERWKFAAAITRIVRFQGNPEGAGHEAPAARLLRLAAALNPYVRDVGTNAEDAVMLPEWAGTGIPENRLAGHIERSREIFEIFARRS